MDNLVEVLFSHGLTREHWASREVLFIGYNYFDFKVEKSYVDRFSISIKTSCIRDLSEQVITVIYGPVTYYSGLNFGRNSISSGAIGTLPR